MGWDYTNVTFSFQTFIEAMPRVKPFYAVKCNPDPVMLRVLASLGCGFDCASAKEIATVLDMGVAPESIVFAHPCKRPLDLEYAISTNVMVCSHYKATRLDGHDNLA
jgi:ornithine decarboxylase